MSLWLYALLGFTSGYTATSLLQLVFWRRAPRG
jgi:hypothetical protein